MIDGDPPAGAVEVLRDLVPIVSNVISLSGNIILLLRHFSLLGDSWVTSVFRMMSFVTIPVGFYLVYCAIATFLTKNDFIVREFTRRLPSWMRV